MAVVHENTMFLAKPVLREISPELTRLVAELDWARTPLGPVSSWSPALRSTVENVLASGFGLLLWWGPDCVSIYNDAYRPVLGAKHPRSLGQPARECWAEIIDVIWPLIEQPLNGGRPSVTDDLELFLHRNGFDEETHFAVAYSPVFDESVPSGIGGVLATVQETTEKVIGERRMRLLRDLAAAATEAKTVTEQCVLAAETIGRFSRDVPFAGIYLRDGDGKRLELRASVGAHDASHDLPLQGRCSDLRPGEVEPADDAGGHRALIAIPSSVAHESTGCLVAGISPQIRFDDRYRDFLTLVAAQIGSAIASARAYEEERRRAEALAEIDRAKNVFFSNVSHEFRTPLTLMLGPLADLAKSVGENEKPLVDSAYRNSLRLLKLVNTLLDFSRLEAGRSDAAYVETDLAALTEEICSVFRSAIESAGLEFHVEMSLTEPVYVDHTMWEKIVLNLLSNALKFTLQGEIRVSLRQAENGAELQVRDSGSGIPAHEVPRVFERFRRIRLAKSRSHEGSGIGLALVKDLVALHGGTINVESQLGKGTTFTVALPFGRTHLDQTAIVEAPPAPRTRNVTQQYLAEVESTIIRANEAPSSPPPSSAASPRRRLLLADDNGDLREYVTRLLSAEYDVTAVRNGAEALVAARSSQFDAILSDVMMPEMDGLELLKAVRADSNLATTPFIMLSARAGEEHAVQGVNAGADDYIAKPFSAEELLARVRANLNASAVRLRASQLSEDRFRDFADRLPLMIWRMDATGAIKFTNAAWHSITGLPRDPSSYEEKAWRKIVHPNDFDRVIPQMYGAIAAREAFTFEYRVKHADAGDDAYRWYVASGELQYAEGAFVGWTGYIVDIHDSRIREETERALRQRATDREREFHALAEAVPVIVWSARSDGWIDWYNNRWYEFTGQTQDEAVGWGWQAIPHPDDLSRVMATWAHSIATGEKFEIEFRLRRHDAVYHWFLARAEPLRDETGAITRWYGSNINIQTHKDTLDQSKRVAETLQGVFLPNALPITPNVRFDAVYVAAEKDALIGGDWYDAIKVPDGRFLVSIGDVAGHGIEASAMAGAIRQSVTSLALNRANPAEILRETNRLVRFQFPDRYATALVGIIDRDCTVLRYASAGHPPPVLAESNALQARSLYTGGVPLGIEDKLEVPLHRVELRRNAVLAFYTDGLTEFARDITTAERTLQIAVSKLVGDTTIRRPAVAVQRAVLGENRPFDDVAVLLVQFGDIDPEALQLDPDGLKKVWRFHSSAAHTARISRHELTKFIQRHARDLESVFSAELILGEILANTVQHAAGHVEIDIDWTDEKPVLTVRDSGPGLSSLAWELPEDPLKDRGRGLFLINALSESVTVGPATGYGTEFRAVLPVLKKK